MGSRTVVIVCRDETVAHRRFGMLNQGIGICYTRTGRRFFADPALETELLLRVNASLTHSGFWDQFRTDWVCLDCELMPWSVKAQELLCQQYAAVGTASHHALAAALASLQQASDRGVEVNSILTHYHQRYELTHAYIDIYRHYCWPVNDLADLKLAPFHILATEGTVHIDQTHDWHMQQIAQLCQSDPELLLATQYRINVTDLQRLLLE
jgi:protein phosphatase